MLAGLLGSLFTPERSRLVARHLRLCSAALPASGVWRGLGPADRRVLFQQILTRGAAPHVAGLSTYDALRQKSPIALPDLDAIGREELAVWLDAAAVAIESLSATLSPALAPKEISSEDEDDEGDEDDGVMIDAEGYEIHEGSFDDEDPPRR